jgi:hypothetical protein
MKRQNFIWVTFQKEGIHCYPDAPEGVEFLRHDHRHIFHFRVEIEVFHQDRDIEFILWKRELEGLYTDGALLLNHKSCEMMADDLHSYLTVSYPNRDIAIEVSEDGENGCRNYYPKGSEA